MKKILKHKGSNISLWRKESNGECTDCFFNESNGSCKRYYYYKLTGAVFQCDETYGSGDTDDDGEEILYTDYFVWVRDHVLDENTVVI